MNELYYVLDLRSISQDTYNANILEIVNGKLFVLS